MIRVLLFVIVGGAIALGVALIPPAMYASPSGRYRVAMAGRSTMDHWFKSWNWPRLVHRYAIWRPWPIAYTKYTHGRYYLEYVPVPGPSFSDVPVANGGGMFDAIARHADPSRYDALFFKFCFVDFDEREMSAASRATRFAQMTALVERVHALTESRGLRLIVGTALPVASPEPEASRLRKDFTEWVRRYGREHAGVAVVDLYAPLVDAQGRLQARYARASYDDHVNWDGFRRLDPGLFQALDTAFAARAR